MTQPKLAPDEGWMGDPKRGASLGRRNRLEYPLEAPAKFYLRRVRINSGGYDEGGSYWGVGLPLYFARDDDREIDMFLRAVSRDDAKWQVRLKYPAAAFYR